MEQQSCVNYFIFNLFEKLIIYINSCEYYSVQATQLLFQILIIRSVIIIYIRFCFLIRFYRSSFTVITQFRRCISHQ